MSDSGDTDSGAHESSGVGGDLLSTAALVWRTEAPHTTVAACEEDLAAAQKKLADAQKWQTSDWQQARDEAHEREIEAARATNAKFQKDRDQVEAQIAEAKRLRGACDDDEVRNDLDKLIEWLGRQLDGELASVPAPTKKKPLRQFMLQQLSELAGDIHRLEQTLKLTRRGWESHQNDTARIRRLAALIAADARSGDGS